MPHVEAHILDVLKKELTFLERGGYRDSDRWVPPFIFEDSPTCIHPDRSQPHPCQQCPLVTFVPPGRRDTEVPCRHIPLSDEGYTLDNMYRLNSSQEIETTVKEWLKKTIAKLEAMDAAEKTPGNPPRS